MTAGATIFAVRRTICNFLLCGEISVGQRAGHDRNVIMRLRAIGCHLPIGGDCPAVLIHGMGFRLVVREIQSRPRWKWLTELRIWTHLNHKIIRAATVSLFSPHHLKAAGNVMPCIHETLHVCAVDGRRAFSGIVSNRARIRSRRAHEHILWIKHCSSSTNLVCMLLRLILQHKKNVRVIHPEGLNGVAADAGHHRCIRKTARLAAYTKGRRRHI